MLFLAYEDLKYLLNRGYRKKYALEFVANHYLLTSKERYFLMRCVFSDKEIEERKRKLLKKDELRGKVIGIDGFNVLITLESLLGGEAILCEDGFLRDLKHQGGYRLHEDTSKILELLVGFLSNMGVKEAWFLYDSPVSRSGEIAKLTEEIMVRFKVPGKVSLSKSPDHDLKRFEVVASSDIAVIQKVPLAVDIPKMIAEDRGLRWIYFLEILEDPYLLKS
ncbi:DUF434 domain-containing protein [Thermococcus argininiproducens]|uniref:DUF434 domain-containing protein n=1 Tax=Thermococcus argininiproducens TaxID=2866384 RepID=A0A9E7MBT3_9EURY|nr:DUF434 domain-containing protein [Thermococcus argininiproducens]USH00515.1 DUF434 domain-containing protein [Thermococcus argininiproducens]